MVCHPATDLSEDSTADLVLSTYFMANEFERYLSSEEAILEVIGVCKGYDIPLIYLETFRDGAQVQRGVLVYARDRLREAGFQVAGAICTTKYGERGDTLTGWPCLTRWASRTALADMFTFAAGLFDTILIDEYIWSHCQCEACQREKGERSWTEFRCEQMRDVLREHVIAPARAQRPDIRLYFKFPAMYEELAHQGQDIDYMLEDFSGIWVGTEVGLFLDSPQNPLRTQGAYRAYFLMEWMREMGGARLGGSWIMPLADHDHLLDTAYQTVLGAPKELVLHPYGGLSPDYGWPIREGEGQFPLLLRDRKTLSELARIASGNPVRGLAAPRPNRTEPWVMGEACDANVFDYVGRLGIPLRPVRDLPEDAEAYFLSLHARSLPDYGAGIEMLRWSRAPILLTDGLASTLDEDFVGKPNVFVIEASVPSPAMLDYRGFSDPYDMANNLKVIDGEDGWDCLVGSDCWDLSMRYSGDRRMAGKIFGMPLAFPEMMKRHLRETGAALRRDVLPLAELRTELLRPFGLNLRGPMFVTLHPFGRDYVVLHNLNAYSVDIWLKVDGLDEIAQVLNLPTDSVVKLSKENRGVRLEMEAHTLVCLRLTRS